MPKMKSFQIVDRVSNHDTTIIQAANGLSALKKFVRKYMMTSGIYETVKIDGAWHMLSSYGSDFEAVPVREEVK